MLYTSPPKFLVLYIDWVSNLEPGVLCQMNSRFTVFPLFKDLLEVLINPCQVSLVVLLCLQIIWFIGMLTNQLVITPVFLLELK